MRSFHPFRAGAVLRRDSGLTLSKYVRRAPGLTEPPDAGYAATHLVSGGPASKFGKTYGLGFQFLFRKGVAGISLGLVDAGIEFAAVNRRDAHLADPLLGIKGVDLGVEFHPHLRAEACDAGVGKRVVFERVEVGDAVNSDQPQNRAHGELRLGGRFAE